MGQKLPTRAGMGMAVYSTFKYEQKLTLNVRLVVGTGHTGGSLRNLPFKVWKVLETCRPLAIYEGRECRITGHSVLSKMLVSEFHLSLLFITYLPYKRSGSLERIGATITTVPPIQIHPSAPKSRRPKP